MFQTLTGSLIILMVIGGIIFGFAVFAAMLAMSIWRQDTEVAAVSAMQAPSKTHRIRKAA